MQETKSWLSAKDVANVLGISESKAYVVIRELNGQLKEQGYIVIAGRVSKKFFSEKYYGFEGDN